MLNFISFVALATLGQAAPGKAVWPESMINSLKPKIHKAHSPSGIHPSSTPQAGQTQTPAKQPVVISPDPTIIYVIIPGPDPGNAEAKTALDQAYSLKSLGKFAKAAGTLETSLIEHPNADVHYEETVRLADLYFRLDRYSDAYDLLSSYVAEYRQSDEAVSLTNQDFLLLTSLALAKAGQVYPGQRDYAEDLLITHQGLDPEDLPASNSAHDVAILSYMALADDFGGDDALWYYQQAYKFGGPSPFLDFRLAGFTARSNPKASLHYLEEAEKGARDTGTVQHEIKYLKQRCEETIARQASSAK